jgi:hypothetical protein
MLPVLPVVQGQLGPFPTVRALYIVCFHWTTRLSRAMGCLELLLLYAGLFH